MRKIKKLSVSSQKELQEQIRHYLELQLDQIVGKVSSTFKKGWRLASGKWVSEKEYRDLQGAPAGFGMCIFSYFSYTYDLVPVAYYVPAGSALPVWPGFYPKTMTSGDVAREGYRYDYDGPIKRIVSYASRSVYEKFFGNRKNVVGWVRVIDEFDAKKDRYFPSYLKEI